MKFGELTIHIIVHAYGFVLLVVNTTKWDMLVSSCCVWSGIKYYVTYVLRVFYSIKTIIDSKGDGLLRLPRETVVMTN